MCLQNIFFLIQKPQRSPCKRAATTPLQIGEGKMKKKVEIVLNRVESALMLTAFPNRTRTNWVEKVSDGAFLFLLDSIESYI